MKNTTLKTSDFKTIFQKEKEEIFRDFFTFLRFESISADPQYAKPLLACADWLKAYLQRIGLKVEKWDTDNAPILFATDLRAGPSCDTLLLYCHYDVQPVDPIDAWTTPPFEPHVRDGKVFARGAVDDKGQTFYTIRALKTLLENFSTLPVNIKLLIEGEEEFGSASLEEILRKKKEALKADHILIVDGGLETPNEPSIGLGVRGLVNLTVTLRGSRFDLHSGVHGGIVYNPNRALVELLASLHDEKGKVTIPSFYDDIVPLTPEEKRSFKLDFDTHRFQKEFGGEAIGMENGATAAEAAWLRPTFEINGLAGGYQGAGFKTVIPAVATAKISCRLVPNQNPERIVTLLKNYLISHVKKGIEIDVQLHPGMGRAVRSSPHSPIAQLAAGAYTEIFQKPCVYRLGGGSIPIAANLAQVSGGDIAFIGVGLATDLIHAPNEHFGLDRFEQGYLILCRIIQQFASKP